MERILIKNAGLIEYQYLYEKFLKLSINGKNINLNANIEETGETFLLEKLKKVINSKIVVFDVGANVGKYTNQLKKILGSESEIYAFEPSESTFSVLEKNTKNLKSTFLYNFGLSNNEEERHLYFDHKNSGHSSVYKRDLSFYNHELGEKEKIKLTTIDIFCENNKIEKIDLLKLDVEGHELSVLEGSKKTIKKINVIQFEFGGCNISSRTFFKDFYDFLCNDFIIYRILKNGFYEIPKYDESKECFLNQNYIAVNKYFTKNFSEK